MVYQDSKTLSYFHSPTVWKRFCNGIFVIREYGPASLPSFLDYHNNIDETGKIKFTMDKADEERGLMKCVERKLSVDVFGQAVLCSVKNDKNRSQSKEI